MSDLINRSDVLYELNEFLGYGNSNYEDLVKRIKNIPPKAKWEYDKDTAELVRIVKAWIDRKDADGCQECAFFDKEEWEMPCVKCMRGCTDYWRRANDSSRSNREH